MGAKIVVPEKVVHHGHEVVFPWDNSRNYDDVDAWIEDPDNVSITGEYTWEVKGLDSQVPTIVYWFTDRNSALMCRLRWG